MTSKIPWAHLAGPTFLNDIDNPRDSIIYIYMYRLYFIHCFGWRSYVYRGEHIKWVISARVVFLKTFKECRQIFSFKNITIYAFKPVTDSVIVYDPETVDSTLSLIFFEFEEEEKRESEWGREWESQRDFQKNRWILNLTSTSFILIQFSQSYILCLEKEGDILRCKNVKKKR